MNAGILAPLLLALPLVAGTPADGQALNHLWSDVYGDANGDIGLAVATDTGGNVVLTGAFLGSVDLGGGALASNGQWDFCVARFDPSGAHLWSRGYGGTADDFGRDVAVDAAGFVMVAGTFESTVDLGGGPLAHAGGRDIFLARFDASGAHVWSRSFGDAANQDAWKVAVDADGNVLLAGDFQGTVDFGGGPLVSAGGSDICVARFDPAGNHMWSRRFGDAASQDGEGVAADADGNIVLSGSNSGTVDFGGGPIVSAGGSDIVVARFDSSGTHLWSAGFGYSGNQSTEDVAVDALGDVLLTGMVRDTVDFGGGPLVSAGGNDMFLAKFTAAGAHSWSRLFGDGNTQIGRSVDTDASGNVVLAGQAAGNVDFGGGVLNPGSIYTGITAARFDGGGGHLWSGLYGGSLPCAGLGVAADAGGGLVLTGRLQGSADFGGGSLSGAGGEDMFLARFQPATTGTPRDPRAGAVRIAHAPNPMRLATTITFDLASPARTHLAVFDASGRRVRTLAAERYPAGSHTVRWDGRDGSGRRVPAGIYFYRLSTPEESAARRLVVLP